MNLLQQWQHKKTWQNCYAPVQAYQSRQTGYIDLDLRNVLSREYSWTFDKQEPSGFDEIAVIPAMFPNLAVFHDVSVGKTIEEIAKDLLEILWKQITLLWDTKMPHIFFASGGRDSRILLWILRDLLKEGVELGDFIIINHEPEHEIFKAAMAEMDFPKQYWRIRKEDTIDKPDYYYVHPLTENVNAFCGPDLIHNQDFYPKEKACLVTGSFGGELTDYPTYRNHRISFGQFLQYTGAPRTHYSELYGQWGDILMPFTSFEYMNYLFHVPLEFFKRTGRVGMNGGDLIRDTILSLQGNHAPFWYRHQYNKQLSPATITRLQKQYLSGKFVQYFSQVKAIVTADPSKDIFNRWEMGSRLYGLASVFEGLNWDDLNPTLRENLKPRLTPELRKNLEIRLREKEWREEERLQRIERWDRQDKKKRK